MSELTVVEVLLAKRDLAQRMVDAAAASVAFANQQLIEAQSWLQCVELELKHLHGKDDPREYIV